jgi:hypothetical protein
MKPSDPDAAKLLRWYPRPWRERYGEEFLAMVEDNLDGERPGLRFRLSVARAGLRERGHRVRLAGRRAAPPVLSALTGRWWTFFVAGFVFAILPYEFKAPSGTAQGWRVTAALAALVAVAVLGGVAVLISGLLALPAFGRFLRAGGWRQIRRRVAWAAGATAAAGGGLAVLVLVQGSLTYDQLSASWVFFLGDAGTGLLLAAAFGGLAVLVLVQAAAGRRLASHAECRRDQQDQAGPAPGPAAAGQGRASTMTMLAAVAVTAVSEWIAVAAEANRVRCAARP